MGLASDDSGIVTLQVVCGDSRNDSDIVTRYVTGDGGSNSAIK